MHKVFEYGKLLLLSAGNGKLPILRDNGEIVILPFSVLLVVGRRVRKANQMPDTPGHKVAAALKISAALFIRAKYGGNRRPDARFLCNYKFHGFNPPVKKKSGKSFLWIYRYKVFFIFSRQRIS